MLAQINAIEYNALSVLYNSLQGENWDNNSGWDFTSFMVDSTWYGITVEQGHIVGIDLNDNNLSGILPDELGNFNYVKNINLASNDISGGIPVSIGNLNQLKNLNLSNNKLINIIPDELIHLTQLRSLWLQNNQISGILPSQLTSIYQLQSLNLAQNNISGYIPADLAKLTSIQFIDLHDNNLTGIIPPDLHLLPNLHHLLLHKNNLSGVIPASLCQNENIQTIDLSLNNLSGSIPIEIAHLTNLTKLNLSYNNLTSDIPEEISDLNYLKVLNLSFNAFSGELPDSIVNLTSLEEINLSFNQFTGNLPDDIGNLHRLKTLRFSNNEFSGELPGSLTTLTNLEHLSLGSNNFSGGFPHIQGRFQQLHTLILSNNSFSELGDLMSIPLNDNTGEGLWINNNNFGFEDILPNIGLMDMPIQYSPQAKLENKADTITLNTGDTLLLKTTIIADDIFYFWHINGQWTQNDSLEPQYINHSILPEKSGEYSFKLKHKDIPELELESEPFVILVTNHAPVIDSLVKDTLIKVNKPLFLDMSYLGLHDEDKNDSLSYYVKQVDGSGLPIWLSFDNENLSLFGVPSPHAKGTLKLEFVVSDKALSKASVSFNLTISDLYSLSGNAWINNVPLNYGLAILFKKNKYYGFQYINNGEFVFPDLDSANYAIQVVPHQDSYPHFFPTYYANAIDVNKTHNINLYGDASGVDITLQKDSTPITGDISLSGEIDETLKDNLQEYPINWAGNYQELSSFATSTQTRLAIPVVLFNSDSIPVSWTLPDENGKYKFTNIPDDDYFIAYQNIREAITDDSKIQLKNFPETNNIISDNIHIFPQLFLTGFTIKRENKIQDVLFIKIFTINGSLIYSSLMHKDLNELYITANGWGNGVYIVCIQNKNNKLISTYKLIK